MDNMPAAPGSVASAGGSLCGPKGPDPVPQRQLVVATVLMGLLALAGISPAAAQNAKSPARSTNCPELGPGFVRVPDSNTCIRTHAAATVDAYGARGISNTWSFGNTVTDMDAGSTDSASTDPWKRAR
ncbi:hypothetical protein [Xanthobacter sp. ZOL 2024]